MTEEELQLNKKICKWLGWIAEFQSVGGTWKRKEYGGFTTSMDTCLEYVVPKLREYGMESSWDDRTTEWYYAIYNKGNDYQPIADAEADTAPLALCRAVEKLIDNE